MKKVNLKSAPRLTDLEITVMKALWDAERPLTIQEITNNLEGKKVSVASVAQAIKHMLAKEAVKVSEHIPVANVYARTFVPCFYQEEFLAAEFKRMQKFVYGTKKFRSSGIAAAYLGGTDNDELSADELAATEKIIAEKRRQLEN